MNIVQTNKAVIRQNIMQVAREEFLKKGYKNTSMRSIARLSGVSLSNIYNYYQDKDEIFQTVLAPLLEAFEQLMAKHNSEECLSLEVFEKDFYLQTSIDDFMLIFKSFRNEMKLLLFGAEGSSLESFKEKFINQQTQMSLNYMDAMRKKFPHINCDVSEFFIHINCSWMMTVLCEIVSHKELNENDIERFLTEYFTFTAAGWKQVMKV